MQYAAFLMISSVFLKIGGLEQNLLWKSKKLSKKQEENEWFSTRWPQNIFNN